jgi:heme-degrading monooxygenase HmoA
VSFAAVFEYEVEPGKTAAFEAVYGAGGEWARFFAGGEGYLGTELLRGSDGAAARFVLIDRWRSAAAYDAFLDTHAVEYRRRNEDARRLYVRERTVGRFDVR